jgi:Zn-dependent M28 family amino/carboxypeptidase
VATRREEARLERDTLPAGQPVLPPRLSAERMMADARALAAPEMEGRRVATEGGRRARDFVARRFGELGLQAPRPGYLQPFEFEHTSIRALWKRHRPVTVRITGAANVLGVVPGREPRAGVLLLTAHYDHEGIREGVLYPGADDNASGVAALLEVARFIRAHPLRHDLLCVAFDGEEVGLRGAEALVADWPVPRERVRFALNLDMVGRDDFGRIVAVGTYHTPALLPVVEQAARHVGLPVVVGHDRPRWRAGSVEDWTDSSDHGPLHDAGVPFLYLGVEDHEDYHQPSDTADRLHPAFLQGAAELVLETLQAVDEAPLP